MRLYDESFSTNRAAQLHYQRFHTAGGGGGRNEEELTHGKCGNSCESETTLAVHRRLPLALNLSRLQTGTYKENGPQGVPALQLLLLGYGWREDVYEI